jgi:acyl-CoA synthetase (AMP-forming)/AMP-acid ligase II
MMMINNIVPIFDKLADYPEGAIQGLAMLMASNPKAVDILTKALSSKMSRAIMRSSVTKNMILLNFKLMAGRAMALKGISLFQKEGVRFLCGAPLFHGAGIEGAFTYFGAIAATTVFLPTPHPFIAREFLEAVDKHRVHTTVIVGDAFALPLVEELRKAKEEGRSYRLKSLWAVVSSGVRWSPHVKKEMLEFMPNTMLIDTMGTSESSGAFASISASSDEQVKAAGAHLITEKSGFYRKQVFPARVIDPETGKDVKPGSTEIGEFLFGGWMTLGYWKCPSKTANDFRMIDGKRWFFVGDEGTVSEDGRFNLIGRGGGYMINSGERRSTRRRSRSSSSRIPRYGMWRLSASPTRAGGRRSPPWWSWPRARRPPPRRSSSTAAIAWPATNGPATSSSWIRCRGRQPGRSTGPLP